jgi:hypothetical protein
MLSIASCQRSAMVRSKQVVYSCHQRKTTHEIVRFLHYFSDPLIVLTFYSSDSLSTELQGHCIAREMSTHSPLSVYHLLYSILIPQHPVPLASMSPNRPRQCPQHPRALPVVPFSPHLKDCSLYSRKLFCFSIFFCRSVTHRSPDPPETCHQVLFQSRSQHNFLMLMVCPDKIQRDQEHLVARDQGHLVAICQRQTFAGWVPWYKTTR